jgi:hypothetical protein
VIRACLLFVACVATCYATCAWLVGLDSDFAPAAIVAVLALGAVICLDFVRHERDRAAYDDDIWEES